MNFHEKQRPISATSRQVVRYLPVPREEHPLRKFSGRRLLAHASAPIFGSRFFFPRYFGRAVERLLDDPLAAGVTPEFAAWYFGPALHLEINPARLKQRISDYVRHSRGDRWAGTSFLDAGDWSEVLAPIEQSPIHREMSELVAAGADYRDSTVYRTLLHCIEIGEPRTRNGIPLRTVDHLEAYFRYCRDLIKSMRKRGVVRHSVSGAFHRLRVKHRDIRSVLLDATERDIGVAVGEGGEIIRHLGGKHRTAIAQALDLPLLPVEVRMVHVRWLAVQMKQTGLPAHLALVAGIRSLAGTWPAKTPEVPVVRARSGF
jgi:hypothetical protein